jgi:hypothetical protein
MIPKEQTYLIYIFSKQSEIDDSMIPNLSHVTNVTNLVGIEDSAALQIALVISFVINSISSVRKSK